MTIRYRKVNGPESAAKQQLSQALQADHAAYSMECELERLKLIGATPEQRADVARTVAHLRRLAIGAVARAKVPRAAISENRRAYLGDWLERLEGEHLTLSVALAEVEASLEPKSGAGALDDDGRSRQEAIRDQLRDEIDKVEKAHSVAAGRWDGLQGKTPKAKADQPPAE